MGVRTYVHVIILLLLVWCEGGSRLDHEFTLSGLWHHAVRDCHLLSCAKKKAMDSLGILNVIKQRHVNQLGPQNTRILTGFKHLACLLTRRWSNSESVWESTALCAAAVVQKWGVSRGSSNCSHFAGVSCVLRPTLKFWSHTSGAGVPNCLLASVSGGRNNLTVTT